MMENEVTPYRYREMAWFYAFVYTTISIGTEVLLIVVARLRIPQDNAIIVPIVLTLPSILAALSFRPRRASAFLALALLTTILTFMLTAVIGRLTGINTGLALPIVVRSSAGFLAFVIARKFGARTRAPGV
jgi:hypothetical protein